MGRKLEDLDRTELLRFTARNAVTMDGCWFREVEKRFGLQAAVEINKDVQNCYAAVESRRIKELLRLEGDDLSTLERALPLAFEHSGMDFGIQRISENTLQLTKQLCLPQVTRKRKGLPEYPCKEVGLVTQSAFARGINANIRVTCLLAPPDEHPENIWCQWLYKI